MKKSTMVFVDKMIKAKKLEQEAMMSLFPENVQGHMKVIHGEVHAMLMEAAIAFAENMTACSEEDAEDGKHGKNSKRDSTVTKVEIG